MLDEKYASKDLIPKGFEYLYVEKGGEFVLRSASEVKTQDDITKLQDANRKEREDHDETKAKLKKWGDLDPDETIKQLDDIPALKARAQGNTSGDEETIKKRVDAEVSAQVAPLQRQINELTKNNETLKTENETYSVKETNRLITDDIRSAAVKLGLSEQGIDDALMHSSKFSISGSGDDAKAMTADGLDTVGWLTNMIEVKTHWLPPSQGGGATGSNGSKATTNPFTHGNWDTTKQGDLYKSDPTRAKQLAEAAGTTIGGDKPPAPPASS